MFDSDFLANPYPVYNHLRSTAPLHWNDKFRTGAWLVPRYEDVAAGLRDPRLSSQRSHTLTAGLPCQQQFTTFNQIFSRLMLFLDPPQHRRLRILLNKGFSPQVVQWLRPRIQQLVDMLVDQMQGKKEIEFMSEFAHRLPVSVIAEMLGVSADDQSNFNSWSDDIADFFGSARPTVELAQRAQESLIALIEYFRTLLPERRKRLGEDLISLLIRVEEEGDVLTEEELLAQCTLLLIAGHETTRNLLGNGLLALLKHPCQITLLKHNPALISSAVKELARYDSPVQFAGRTAVEDFVWHDQQIKKGQTVVLLLGSANRDQSKFNDAENLDVTRNQTVPLSFGHGPHFCIGATLASLEAEIAFSTLLERKPELKLINDKPEWRSNFSFRGLRSLPLSC
jgi:cytochrome P450